jgi:hypothetical protein
MDQPVLDATNTCPSTNIIFLGPTERHNQTHSRGPQNIVSKIIYYQSTVGLVARMSSREFNSLFGPLYFVFFYLRE